MDQLTSDLLTNWGLNEYVRAFCEGKVDAGILRLLGDDEIVQLIPIPGDRARFKINLANWKQEINQLDTGDLSSNATPNLPTLSVSTRSDVDSLGDYLASYLGDPNTSSSEHQLQGQHPPSDPVKILSLTSNSEDIPRPGPSSSCLGSVCLNESSHDSHLSKYVLKTLQSTLDGKSILAEGQSTGKLDETQRNLLVKLLIQPLFESDQNRQFTNKQLLTWSLEIQEIFPKESPALYYTPYVAAHVRATARNASGKLLRYVYNRRRQLRERGIIPASSRSRSSSKSSSASASAQRLDRLGEDTITEQEITDRITWLKNSLEPWHLVEENWSATSKYRLRCNYEKPGTLQEYFQEFPVLKLPTGYILLLRDFEVLFEDNYVDNLFTNIVILRKKIIDIARKKSTSIRDKDVKKSINNYVSAATIEPESSDVLNNASLLLLPYITSSVPLKDKKKSPWRPSKSEVRDGFITQIASDAELTTTIASRKSKLERYGKTLQPFVVFVGRSIAEISHCYVVAGDTYYTFDKLLNAVDACFKIIHATGAQYQEESFVIWMVIQKGFYKLSTIHDKELTTVNSLFVDLEL